DSGDDHRRREERSGQREREAAPRRADLKVAREDRQKRLNAVEEREGGEAAGEEGEVGAAELRRPVPDERLLWRRAECHARKLAPRVGERTRQVALIGSGSRGPKPASTARPVGRWLARPPLLRRLS